MSPAEALPQPGTTTIRAAPPMYARICAFDSSVSAHALVTASARSTPHLPLQAQAAEEHWALVEFRGTAAGQRPATCVVLEHGLNDHTFSAGLRRGRVPVASKPLTTLAPLRCVETDLPCVARALGPEA